MTNQILYDKIKSWAENEERPTVKLEMENVLKELEKDMALQLAKAKGGNAITILKAAARIIDPKNVRHILRGMSQDRDNGKWTVCDGFRFVQFNDKPDLPDTDDPNGRMAFSKLVSTEGATELHLPSVVDLKLWCQTHKRKVGRETKIEDYVLHDVEGTAIYVNPKYLIDMIEALPNAKVGAHGQLRGIVFEAENGIGMLLPVRPPEEDKSNA